MALIAVAAWVVAARVQADATRPVGEGELFAHDTAMAAATLTDADDPFTAVRTVRNALTIEAVSLVDGDLMHVASTSPNLVATRLEIPFFQGNPMPLRALAAPMGRPILIDGIEEWAPDDILYQVMSRLDDGRMAVLVYDLQELAARRAIPDGIRPETLEVAGIGLLFALIAVGLLAGRAGARRRLKLATEASEVLEQRARELAVHNEQLAEARSAAERALALAEEKNRIRSEFVLMINHELNTPLTGVVTSAELLAAHPDMPEDDRSALVEAMVREGDQLRALIGRMLTLARIENKGLGYRLRPTEPATLAADIRGATQSSRVVEPKEAFPVMVDPEGVVSLVATLAENAHTHGASTVTIEFSPTLPFEPDLIIGSAPEAAMWVSVRDDGPGIEPEFLPRIFEKFEKRSDSPGTGLGLYLARLIAEAMEGAIAVSTAASGTTMALGVGLARQREAA